MYNKSGRIGFMRKSGLERRFIAMRKSVGSQELQNDETILMKRVDDGRMEEYHRDEEGLTGL